MSTSILGGFILELEVLAILPLLVGTFLTNDTSLEK
jgi:hypothetical protein